MSLGRVLLVAAGVLAAGVAFVFCSLSPPAPLPVPERGALLTGVTVLEPGGGGCRAARCGWREAASRPST